MSDNRSAALTDWVALFTTIDTEPRIPVQRTTRIAGGRGSGTYPR